MKCYNKNKKGVGMDSAEKFSIFENIKNEVRPKIYKLNKRLEIFEDSSSITISRIIGTRQNADVFNIIEDCLYFYGVINNEKIEDKAIISNTDKSISLIII